MKIKELRRLQKARIMNMKGIYEDAGCSVSSMNSRISTSGGKISLEEANALELTVCNKIASVVELLGIQRSTIANVFSIPINIKQAEIGPLAYHHSAGGTIAIYLPEDKVILRAPISGTKMESFWNFDKIMRSLPVNADLKLTLRGLNFMDQKEMDKKPKD